MGRTLIQTNLLQCSSCNGIYEVSPEIYQSSDFINKLHHDLKMKCDKCQASLKKTQSKASTNSFQSVMMFCKNRNNGCTKELHSFELPAHEINCDFRPVRCLWHLQCDQKEISFRSYREHLEKKHQLYIKKIHLNQWYDVVIETLKDHDVRVSSVLCDEKKHFYFTRRCFIDLRKNIFMVCVHFIGDKDTAKKFIYKVKIPQGIDSLHTYYEFSAFCAPCVESPTAPDAHSQCIILNPKKLFLTNDYLSKLEYSVTIKRVKELADT